jgi:hypothetical protein
MPFHPILRDRSIDDWITRYEESDKNPVNRVFFEGRPPEFFKDWRFLLVGLRWRLKKLAAPPGEAKIYPKSERMTKNETCS